jgi:hypothetical protein
MKPISPTDIMSKQEYASRREDMRRRIMALKAKRRVPLGEHVTLHFETRDTMLYQVHEMLRAEDSWERPDAIEDELEAYNPLIPGGNELSATLFLEYETPEERNQRLQDLLGIDRHLWLQVGDTEPLLARFDQAQVSPTRVSSVQYVKWPIDSERARLVATDGTVVRARIDHPAYEAQAVLSEETRKEIARDLE